MSKKNTHYNVEMQATSDKSIGKRTRYYHSQIDMELLLSGIPYSELPDSYVIFICDFDPFGQKKYCYTAEHLCKEAPEAQVNDGSHSIFLSTRGKNRSEVSEELVKFLEFVGTDLEDSMKDFEDEYVRSLQESMISVKGSREMEERYMLFEEMLREERAEGKAEGKAESILELFEDESVPENLKERILNEKDLSILKRWHKLAARAASIEEFMSQM